MRRVSVAFLAAGSLAALAGTAVPDPDPADHGALYVLAAICGVLAVGLKAWRRPPAAVLTALPAVGILLAGAAVAVAQPLASTPTYYLLPVLASAYFSGRRQLLAELGLFAVSFGVVLVVWVPPEAAPAAIFLGTVIPALGVAVVVGGLKRRLDAQVDVLHDRANRDPLTGLLNHGAFHAALDDALARCAQLGTPATLLLLDIDHFKQVNDRFGHQEGDRMLRVVSDVLTGHRRRDDLLGRVGGEEFALLVADADVAAAHAVAERIRAALRGATARTPAPLTLSVGIAAATADAGTPGALFKAADEALYAAKRRGRDRAVDAVQAQLRAA